jgi:hypothetical protein
VSQPPKTLTIETAAWLGLLLLAAWTRLSALGRLPLDNAEAAEALAAAAASANPSGVWEAETPTASASLHSLTALVFSPFSPTDALARLVPALAGVGLVMSPLLARRSLGRGTALAAGIMLLLSPAALTTARTASGASLAALGWMVALLGLIHRRAASERGLTWAAVGAGAALASGAHGLMGLITLVGGWLLYSYWERRLSAGAAAHKAPGRRRKSTPEDAPALASLKQLPGTDTRISLALGTLTLFILVTGGGLFPSGLPGLFEGAAGWIRGWTHPSGYGVPAFLAMLPLYESLPLVFGLVGARMAARDRAQPAHAELAWAAAALVLLLIYPGRTPLDLNWIVLPLALLGGRALVALFEKLPQVESWPAVAGFGAAAVVLVAYAFLQVAGYTTGAGLLDVNVDFALQLGLAALGLVLAALSLLFLGWGWSWAAAVQAAGLAGLALSAVLTLSAGWRLNYEPAAAGSGDLWRRDTNTPGQRLLAHSLRMISQAQTGQTEDLALRFLSPPTPGLGWELRDFRLAGDDPAGLSPQVVLTPEGEEPPALAEDYLGQSFTIGERWGWDSWLPPDLLRWLVARQAPTEAERWLLLVRSDLAGAGELPPAEVEPAS